jgi:hypothetical protein
MAFALGPAEDELPSIASPPKALLPDIPFIEHVPYRDTLLPAAQE